MTNGEDLRVTGSMKPIATLMKPLRSVDLASMKDAPAAIERSDVCAVPAAAVVAEAMVALVVADALLERFGGDSIATIEHRIDEWRTRTRARYHVPAADSGAWMIRPILRHGEGPLHRPARTVENIDGTVASLVDDMIETMHHAPGVGLAAPQIGVDLRLFVLDTSVGARPRPARADQP